MYVCMYVCIYVCIVLLKTRAETVKDLLCSCDIVIVLQIHGLLTILKLLSFIHSSDKFYSYRGLKQLLTTYADL